MIETAAPQRAQKTGLLNASAGTGPDTWLARLFLFAVLAAGLVSYIIGASPEGLAICPCPFHLVTGIECPGCGMTRACIALAQGDFESALFHNPFSFGLILFALGFAVAPHQIRRFWRRLPLNTRNLITWALFAAILIFWAHRVIL